MTSQSRSKLSVPFRRVFVAAMTLLCLLIVSGSASAASVRFRGRTFKEKRPGEDGYWVIGVTINLNKAPTVGRVPVTLVLKQKKVFKRYLLDGDKKTTKTEPVKVENERVVSELVPFMNKGRPVKVSIFAFEVNREGDNDAGVYEAELRDKRTGRKIGGSTTITLKGENLLDDRRSIGFGGKKKEEPKKEVDIEKPETTTPEPIDDSNLPEVEHNNEYVPMREKKKPGGCGCRLEGGTADPTAPLGGALLVGLGLALAARRRRRAA